MLLLFIATLIVFSIIVIDALNNNRYDWFDRIFLFVVGALGIILSVNGLLELLQ